MQTAVTVRARCVCCSRVYTPSAKEMQEAREFGCLMTSCCSMPATVEEVSTRPIKGRRAGKVARGQ